MLNFWFRAVPGSEERKRTKIRFGRFLVPKNRKEPRFETSEDRKKRNQDSFVLTKIRSGRASVFRRTGKRELMFVGLIDKGWRSDELINFL
ncbi:unnamed protein product [Rhizophagus irregularis]|nr:unnamed protein product [Rhizophagus irregularis]